MLLLMSLGDLATSCGREDILYRKKALDFVRLLGIYRLFNIFTRRAPKILVYHTIIKDPVPGETLSYSNVSAEDFEWQMQYLVENYRLISLEDYVQSINKGESMPLGSAIITFDDGFRGIYTSAYPVLQKYSVPATIFVCVEFIGKGILQWDTQIDHLISNTKVRDFELELGTLCRFDLSSCAHKIAATYEIQRKLSCLDEPARQLALQQLETKLATEKGQFSPNLLPLTWDQLKDMSNNGISIGSHTMSHPNLTKISRAQAQREIADSKEIIENEIGSPVQLFSFPFGIFNAEVKAMVRTSYQGAVALVKGASQDDMYCLRRIGVYGTNTKFEFIAKLSVLEPLFSKVSKVVRRRHRA